jgi:hypothetical protein
MGDGRLQPACFRLCLSRAHDRRPLTDPPPRYDRSRYVLVERYLASLVRSGARLEMHDVLGVSDLPNDKVDVNSHGPFSTNLPGGLDGYLAADRIGRAEIVRRHRDWAAGLLHFLATDAAVPDPIRAIVEPLGYPADEFVDDDGWPHQLYNIDIREIAWVAAPIPRFPDLGEEVLVEGYLSVPGSALRHPVPGAPSPTRRADEPARRDLRLGVGGRLRVDPDGVDVPRARRRGRRCRGHRRAPPRR